MKRPTLGDVQAALTRGEIVVWREPDDRVELLAARDPFRPASAVTVVVLGQRERAATRP